MFLHARHSNVWFLRFAMAMRPHKLQTCTLYGSEASKSRSLRNWAAPWAIWQSRSISPKRKPPSLKNNLRKFKQWIFLAVSLYLKKDYFLCTLFFFENLFECSEANLRWLRQLRKIRQHMFPKQCMHTHNVYNSMCTDV